MAVKLWGLGISSLELGARVVQGVMSECEHTRERVPVELGIIKTHSQKASLHGSYNLISQEMN